MLRNDHEPSRAKFAPLTMNYAGMGPLGQAWETLPFPRSLPASPSPLSGAALCRGREVAGRRFRPFFQAPANKEFFNGIRQKETFSQPPCITD